MLRFITEVGPLLAFFIAFKFFDLVTATIMIVITTVISTGVTFYLDKKVSIIPLITAVLVVIMGGLTYYSGNTMFIKMKPTVLNLVFALALYVGLFFRKGLLKYVFGGSVIMTEEKWMIFSQRWAWFFLIMAVINELVWRNFSENFWVSFKVFGILGMTTIFLFSQLPFLSKYGKKSTLPTDNSIDYNQD